MSITYLPVEEYNYTSKDDFQEFVESNRRPLVIRNYDIGECKTKWTTEYLSQTVGKVPVKVHISPTGRMSFLDKNFTYKMIPFDSFLYRASKTDSSLSLKPILCQNEVFYLRSLGFDRRGKDVTDMKKQFPQISDDIQFPNLFEEDNFFSSVFRISSEGVQIWTHYDVMDNALIQVVGSKRVILFKPSDLPYLYMEGDKSKVIDIDKTDLDVFPEFVKAVQYKCVLSPGDVLYIPALWFHNILSMTFSIGTNIFWKHLPHEMYNKHDVYGNKDVIPGAKALQHIRKAAELLKSLPHDHRTFYSLRCCTELYKIVDTSGYDEISVETSCIETQGSVQGSTVTVKYLPQTSNEPDALSMEGQPEVTNKEEKSG